MYTVDQIRKALIPVIGDGEATKKILESFPDADMDRDLTENDIVVRTGYETEIFKIVHHSTSTGKYKCKSWNGIVVDMNRDELVLATDNQRMRYYKNQTEFLRTNIAPFLNFFHMRQLQQQIKDEDSRNDIVEQLSQIERTCLDKLEGIKKLW